MNRTIESKENQIYKQINSLNSKKYRDRLSSYIVEGEKLVVEAVESGMADIVVVESGRNIRLPRCEVNPVFMEGKLFRKLTHTENSQGIFAVVKNNKISDDEFLRLTDGDKTVVLLDRLQDPGNVGSIIRTAAAAGVGGLIVIKGTVDIYSPKVVRAAANAIWKLPIVHVESWEAAVKIVRRGRKKLVATAMKDAIDYCEYKPQSQGTAIIIGNEGSGISRELIEESDIRVKIPMERGMESLNAAVAAGILMYQWKGRE